MIKSLLTACYLRKHRISIMFLLTCCFIAFTQAQTDSVALKKEIRLQPHVFKTLSAKAKLVWDDGSAQQEFIANFRVQKDSLIWSSFGIMGIEGVRTLATRDSFRLLNKLTNEYMVKDFEVIKRWLLLGVTFNMLQQIIAGDKIDIQNSDSLAAAEDSTTVYYFESNTLLEKVWVDTVPYTIKKILLKDKLINQNMLISFDAYNYTEEKPFSYKRQITITRGSQSVKLSMDFIKLNFDRELTFPFEVTDKYKRVE